MDVSFEAVKLAKQTSEGVDPTYVALYFDNDSSSSVRPSTVMIVCECERM